VYGSRVIFNFDESSDAMFTLHRIRRRSFNIYHRSTADAHVKRYRDVAIRVIVESREFRDTGGNCGNDTVRGRHINYGARACVAEISNSSVWASHTGSNPGLEGVSYG